VRRRRGMGSAAALSIVLPKPGLSGFRQRTLLCLVQYGYIAKK